MCSTKCFGRVFREIIEALKEEAPDPEVIPSRIGKKTLKILQDAAEAYMVEQFTLAALSGVHAQRKTLYVKDFEFVRSLRMASEGYKICPNEQVMNPSSLKTKSRGGGTGNQTAP